MTGMPPERPRPEPLPDADFTRVLCVVAHPDDMEYGSSAAVAKWVSQGVEVSYLLLTTGEAGMQIDPAEVGPLRAKEQWAACEAVGVSDLTILDFPDGMLMYGLDLRKAIARVIRQKQPDVVLTGSWVVSMPWGLNQADHRAAGLATLDACRDADNTWVFRELADEEGLAKWGPRWLLVNGDATATHYVDVSGEPLAKGIASLACHKAYLAALPWHPSAEEMYGTFTGQAGQAVGVDNAVMFRAHRLRQD
ncbi:MAG TPA: PIG-L family deacetylase [Propionibacteriaceae bacterium]|nr:PIG-L family deacetylase [Propionibacteriaceae bacterium]